MRIKEVSLIRMEGPIDETDVELTFNTIQDANKVLLKWAVQMEDRPGYDKVKFYITWIDGSTYSGRYDLQHPNQGQDEGTRHPNILLGVRQYVGYMARLPEYKPASQTDEEYWKGANVYPGEAQRYTEYYEKYLDPNIKGNGLAEDGPWKCPTCEEFTTDYPALSRRDNKTEICSDCGTREAVEDFHRAGAVALNPGNPENLHKTLMGIFGK